MIRKFAVIVLIPLLLMNAGCALLVAGAATGAGVYVYMNGELTRIYQASYENTVSVCEDSLQSLKMVILEQEAYGVETIMKAENYDGTPVRITVTMEGPRITEVAIRSGILGVWSKDISELIHATIAQRLY